MLTLLVVLLFWLFLDAILADLVEAHVYRRLCRAAGPMVERAARGER